MNKLTIIGNVTRDPELRQVQTSNGPVNVCDFTVAVNDRHKKGQDGQPEATFFRCTAWRGLADVVSKYCTKGTKVSVVGPVSGRAYTPKDGAEPRVSLEVQQVEDFEFVSSGGRPSDGNQPGPAEKKADFTPVQDDILPF